MESKKAKKEAIRKQIISAAGVYKSELAGKVFLYVYGREYFEIVFKVESFMHRTGVDSSLYAKQFYNYSKAGKLTNNQFYFSDKHPFAGAKEKLSCLVKLPLLTNSLVCVLKDMATVTLTYKIGVTNLDFTLGLTENIDAEGNKINDMYLPRTLRIKDDSIAKSKDGDFVDFILMRDASVSSYDTIMYKDEKKKLPETVQHLISSELYDMLKA